LFVSIVMMFKKNFFFLRVSFFLNFIWLFYQIFTKFNALFTKSQLSLTKEVESTYFTLTWPVFLNLFIFGVIVLLFQTTSNDVDFTNLFLIRYTIFLVRKSPKLFSLVLLNSLMIFFRKVDFNAITLKTRLTVISSFLLSYFILWRPLFKRISYYGRLLKNRNFWRPY
jgi:hypothetical protein